MDEHVQGDEQHPARNGGALGLVARTGKAVIGCALAVAVVATTAVGSSLPPQPVRAPATAPDGVTASATDDVPVPVAKATADDTSPTALDQVFAVLERAERAAADSGRPATPQIQQAAAELGMLLTSYLATHPDAAGHARATWSEAAAPLLRTGPVTPALNEFPLLADQQDADPAETPAPTTTPSASPTEEAATPDEETASADEETASADEETASADETQASPDDTQAAADDEASSTDEDSASAGEGTGGSATQASPDVVEDDEVTFADVWAATLRLAALLDPAQPADPPATPAAVPDDGSTPLTESLREVVARWSDSTDGYLNGRIPADVLCELDFAPGQRLRCDAAAQLEDLDAAYRQQFGTDIPVTDSYRPYDAQVRVKEQKGWLAATPGYSNHGWGLAVDLGTPINTGASARYLWLRLHGPDYGWDNPSWARLDGSKPEPWHFEFFAAGPMPSRALSEADVQLWQADRAESSPEPAPGEPAPAVPTTPAVPDLSALEITQTTPPTEPLPTVTATPTPGASEPAPSPTPTPSDDPSPTRSDPGSPEPTPSPSEPAPPPSDPSPVPTPSNPTTATVPDVRGLSMGDALTALGRVGFVHVSVSDQRAADPAIAVGLVATTSPAEGTSARVDDAVVLVLSSGPASAPSPTPTPSGSDSAPAPSGTGVQQPRRAARRANNG